MNHAFASTAVIDPGLISASKRFRWGFTLNSFRLEHFTQLSVG
jgi:hypothetical protein